METIFINYLYTFGILFLIIGIPMVSMGYLDGMNANNYMIVHANITEYMHAQFYLKDKIAECHILTGNNVQTHQYYEYRYPIGSTIKLFYDFNTKMCRTEKFVTNLAIAGLFFFILSILLCTIACYYDPITFYDGEENQTYTNVNTTDKSINDSTRKSINDSTNKPTNKSIDYDIENQNAQSLIPSAPTIQTNKISNNCIVINAFPVTEED